MDNYTSYEQAFQNGYEKGLIDGLDSGYDKGKSDATVRWIPVTERLPENRDDVLLCRKWWNEIRNPQMGWYNDVSGEWFDVSNRVIHNVTHWMPLPQPPKEPVYCKDCEHLMFSDCYGECSKGYKGIVKPNDTCEHGVRRKQEGDDGR